MSQEKRIVLLFAFAIVWMLAASYLRRWLGWEPPPKQPAQVAAVAKDKRPNADAAATDAGPVPSGKAARIDGAAVKEGAAPGAVAEKGRDAGRGDTRPKLEPKAPPERPETKRIAPAELVLGSDSDKTPGGYRIAVQLEQEGAGVESVSSSQYDAEFKYGELHKRPVEFIHGDWDTPPSLSLTLTRGDQAGQAAAALAGEDVSDEEKLAIARAAAEAADTLDSEPWDVVNDPATGKAVRSIVRTDPVTKADTSGQAVVFQIKAKMGVVVTKTYRLLPNTDGFEVELKFESPDRERSVVYNLLGPHGIPIEGLWYTSTFRDVFFGQLDRRGEADVKTHSAYDVAAAKDKPIDNTALPLRFAGVENQYFADLIEPYPPPTSQEDRWDSRAVAEAFVANRKRDDQALQHADVGVRISSKPITVGPDKTVVHTYRVFTGPKTAAALGPYGAAALASYRKPSYIPGAASIAWYVITPILHFTYELTVRVARLFGATKGNYGIAIILLTVLVRALMFPLGRKAALSAQKMQSLQPLIKELQEKYKDDKEKQARETWALYGQHGVNPLGGCLPALIQLPIFVGLWQALNTSFQLRHASFLWIRDLSAPDQLFHLPFELLLPFGWGSLGSWFNLLPFLVVGLMLVQTKLFSPPATTPDAEMQQKSMKFMMILMGAMFYKVPSGLGIYFITSSLWSIGERLLLPKVTHAKASEKGGAADGAAAAQRAPAAAGSKGSYNGDSSGNGANAKAPGWFAQLWGRLLEEARKDPTYRKAMEQREAKGRDQVRDKDKPRPKPRRR
jgi:YidC/Oxa1 family membrane protein insertase